MASHRRTSMRKSRQQRKSRKQRGSGFFNFFTKKSNSPAPSPAPAPAPEPAPAPAPAPSPSPSVNINISVPPPPPPPSMNAPTTNISISAVPTTASTAEPMATMNSKMKMNGNRPMAVAAPRRSWKNYFRGKANATRKGMKNTAGFVKGQTRAIGTAMKMGPGVLRNAYRKAGVF